jgi:cytochrome c
VRRLLLIGGALAASAAVADEGAMRGLAEKAGCASCHRETPASKGWDKLIPLTPSWREIAVRYRDAEGAEDTLTAVVLQGTGTGRGDRHWQGIASIPAMPPNRIEVTAAQARELVRWILAKGEPR